MGTRRNDITGKDRAQIAMEMLPAYRPYGKVTELAQAHEVSRQTIYNITAVGKSVLNEGMEPGRHGPQPKDKKIEVNRNRLERSTVVLTEVGVSQRDVAFCLEEMLDTRLSSSWVNAELAKREEIATVVNRSMQPEVIETMSGDEIYSNGQPNLLVVGNETLYIYALTRQPGCDGETWGCVLLDIPESPQFASDAGTGLAAGAEQAGVTAHQLDWDHLLRPLWGQCARLERQAYAALKDVEERATKFAQATTPKRLKQHLDTWEELQVKADEKMACVDAFSQLAQQVDAQFALIDLQSGQLRDPIAGAECLRLIGKQMSAWEGRIYKKLSTNLINWAPHLFGYHSVLSQAFVPLTERWGLPAIQALSRIWQIEAEQKRHPMPVPQQQACQALWEASLDQAFDLLGLDQLFEAWQDLSSLFNKSWRGSMLAEFINSLLRPVLDRRKQSDQGCLELFRFFHNVRPFARGKRANHSPAELANLALPQDPLLLLGFAPKCQSNSLSS